jgi:hypothetical protein|tara:strand:- start:844 stop:1038 length:195 start_codon:yes stop_codon:yes gene_type:complete
MKTFVVQEFDGFAVTATQIPFFSTVIKTTSVSTSKPANAAASYVILKRICAAYLSACEGIYRLT